MVRAKTPAVLIRLRPASPWRIGPSSGSRDAVDRVFHSDTLYSAVSSAMGALGCFDDWLAATATTGSEPAVRLSSMFPWLGSNMFAAPPKSHWPPTPSAKVRWKSASFVPLELIRSLLAGEAADENKWVLDPISECLLPLDRGVSEGPFRIGFRSAAAVDRLAEGTACAHGVSVLEFVENAGWWAVAAFSSEESRERWRAPVEGAFRLLADSGFGGERSRGWGRAHAPQLEDGVLPDLLVPPRQEAVSPGPIESEAPAGTCAWWLLSLFVPSENDRVDWKRGRYDLLARSGRVESPAGWGIEKKQLKMVSEGSVLEAEGALSGCVTDVAPDAFPHPVYKAGFALAVAIPKRVNP